jgi:hypothetical protein
VNEVQYLGEARPRGIDRRDSQGGARAACPSWSSAQAPQLTALAGEARSSAERLFDYPDVGPLPEEVARDDIRTPLRREGVEIDEPALALIVEQTKGYPYFLPEWGAQAWNAAKASPIAFKDTRNATSKAIAQLDKGFFRVRLDRLTPRERDYMREMAELGPGPSVASSRTFVRGIAPLRLRANRMRGPAAAD